MAENAPRPSRAVSPVGTLYRNSAVTWHWRRFFRWMRGATQSEGRRNRTSVGAGRFDALFRIGRGITTLGGFRVLLVRFAVVAGGSGRHDGWGAVPSRPHRTLGCFETHLGSGRRPQRCVADGSGVRAKCPTAWSKAPDAKRKFRTHAIPVAPSRAGPGPSLPLHDDQRRGRCT